MAQPSPITPPVTVEEIEDEYFTQFASKDDISAKVSIEKKSTVPSDKTVMSRFHQSPGERLPYRKKLKTQVPEIYHEFLDVFDEFKSYRLPKHSRFDVSIDIKDGISLDRRGPIYSLTETEDKACKAWLEEMLAKGYIRPSKSPYTSPLFFVDKADGSLRPVVDYTDLNGKTVKDRYPQPNATDLINQLQGADMFTCMDLRWGFHHALECRGCIA